MRYFVGHRTDGATCLEVVRVAARASTSVLNTDEWRGYARVEATGLRHATVRHGQPGRGRREWARDSDGDGVREVYCNGCEGVGTGLRNFLRVFRGVYKKNLSCYVATFETMTNAKQFTASILQRMCSSESESQSKET